MGRRPVEKSRNTDEARKRELAMRILPYFLQHGLRNATMDQLARHAQCSKATLYRYFETHRELVQNVVALKLGELSLFERLLTDQYRPYIERYTLAVAYVSRNLGDVTNLFLTDLKALYPDLWHLIDQFKQFALGILRAFYVDGITAKVFNAIDPDILVLSDELFFDALTNPEFLTKKGIDLQAAFESYFEMRFYGILHR